MILCENSPKIDKNRLFEQTNVLIDLVRGDCKINDNFLNREPYQLFYHSIPFEILSYLSYLRQKKYSEKYLLTPVLIKEQQLVEKTCEYLLENFSEDLSINYIARQMATNRSTLSSAFKRILGVGVSRWLRQIRMEKAKELLTTTTLSVQEISYDVGYDNPANFSTSFKGIYYISPKGLRHSLGENMLKKENQEEYEIEMETEDSSIG